MMKSKLPEETIRIGTLVPASQAVQKIPQIMHHGFESFSLTFWRTIGQTDLKKLANEMRRVLDGTGIVISSLSLYGNPLEADVEAKEARDSWRKLIDHAHLFGTNLVTGFTGRIRGKPIPDSMPAFGKVFGPLAKRAKDKGVRLAFENCEMRGNWESGDFNIAHTPACWELMFNEVSDKNVGLEWEPCHQMIKLIDPLPQLRKWMPKIFHVHGKDANVHWDVIREHGIQSGHKFAFHRTPGFGDCNWSHIFSELRLGKYEGFIDIEGFHDPVYRGEWEMTGQVHALHYLKKCRGGDRVANPL